MNMPASSPLAGLSLASQRVSSTGEPSRPNQSPAHYCKLRCLFLSQFPTCPASRNRLLDKPHPSLSTCFWGAQTSAGALGVPFSTLTLYLWW